MKEWTRVERNEEAGTRPVAVSRRQTEQDEDRDGDDHGSTDDGEQPGGSRHLAAFGASLYVVNARFDVAPPPLPGFPPPVEGEDFDIVRVDR